MSGVPGWGLGHFFLLSDKDNHIQTYSYFPCYNPCNPLEFQARSTLNIAFSVNILNTVCPAVVSAISLTEAFQALINFSSNHHWDNYVYNTLVMTLNDFCSMCYLSITGTYSHKLHVISGILNLQSVLFLSGLLQEYMHLALRQLKLYGKDSWDLSMLNYVDFLVFSL